MILLVVLCGAGVVTTLVGAETSSSIAPKAATSSNSNDHLHRRTEGAPNSADVLSTVVAYATGTTGSEP